MEKLKELCKQIEDDINSFRSILIYWAMRKESEKRGWGSLGVEPLDIYEHFAQFAATTFDYAATRIVHSIAESKI